MWTYLFSFLLLRRMGLSKPIRYALAVFLIGLILRFSSTPSFCFSTLRKGRNPTHDYAPNLLPALL